MTIHCFVLAAVARCKTGTASLRSSISASQARIPEMAENRDCAKPPQVDCFVRDNPMVSSSADISTILNRILDTAAENLRIAKILAQMGLDPSNITYDALFDRLLEIVLANITLATMFALLGAIFFVATLLMQTMVPLRVANMVGCTFFATSGALSGNVANFLLYLLLLPINAIRLRQMLKLVKKARNATQGDMRMAQTVHDRTQISPGRQIIQEGGPGCRNVTHRHGKVSGQGNRRRASARKHHGRTWLPYAEQPTNHDDRVHGRRTSPDHNL